LLSVVSDNIFVRC